MEDIQEEFDKLKEEMIFYCDGYYTSIVIASLNKFEKRLVEAMD